ncbi:MAG: dihydropteroate synthase, partial [Nitrospirota bacterium]|nr:dihydropteroate synthase [Nitrospirota bacterium]
MRRKSIRSFNKARCHRPCQPDPYRACLGGDRTTALLPSASENDPDQALVRGQAMTAPFVANPYSPPTPFKARAYSLPLHSRVHLMGILNVTPDSFSDGGRFLAPDAAVAHALAMVEAGADIIDIGAESTRPGSTPVDEREEIRRLIPVVREVCRRVSVPISVDTTKASVAKLALEAGASIINDISALRHDVEMGPVV